MDAIIPFTMVHKCTLQGQVACHGLSHMMMRKFGHVFCISVFFEKGIMKFTLSAEFWKQKVRSYVYQRECLLESNFRLGRVAYFATRPGSHQKDEKWPYAKKHTVKCMLKDNKHSTYAVQRNNEGKVTWAVNPSQI